MAVVLTIALSSYLALCFTSLAMSTRSIMAGHSQEIAEAGIEQAIYAVNNNATSGWNVASDSPILGTTTISATMTMTSAGLVLTSLNPTPLNFGNAATGLVNITMTYPNGSFSPQTIQSITSQGVVKLPMGTIVSAATPSVSKTLSYYGPSIGSTACAPLFVNAIAATSGKIKFTKAATVDSFNSNPSVAALNKGAICVIAAMGTTTNAQWMAIGAPSNPIVGTSFTATGPGVGTGTVYENYNSNLINVSIPNYYINKGYSAIVASQDGSTATATVALKNAVINGYVEGYDYSSPASTNWLSYVTNVGEVVGPNTPTGEYIDPSRILTSPVPYQPVVLEPTSLPSGLSPPYTYYYNYTSQTTLGTAGTATTVYNAGSAITLGTGSVLNVVGPVIIIAHGNITLSGTALTGGMIELTTPTASLQIFQESGNLSIGGQGIQNLNTNPLPKCVALVDTVNSSGTVTFSTTSPFYGVIYFPYMPVTVSSSAVIYGSIVGSSVSFTGNAPALHYDLALRNPDTAVGDAAFANITAPMTVSNLVTSVP